MISLQSGLSAALIFIQRDMYNEARVSDNHVHHPGVAILKSPTSISLLMRPRICFCTRNTIHHLIPAALSIT